MDASDKARSERREVRHGRRSSVLLSLLTPLSSLLVLLYLSGCRSDVQGVKVDFTKLRRAADLYAQAKRARNDDLTAQQHNDIGVALEMMGNPAAAMVQYRLALRKDPKLIQAWTNVGNALRKLEQPEQALAAYRKALAINPNYFEAANNFADLCAQQRVNLPEAESTLRRALAEHPADEAFGLDTLAWVLIQQGRYQGALDLLDQPPSRNEQAGEELTASVHYHRALALRGLEKRDEADAELSRAASVSCSRELHNAIITLQAAWGK